MSKQKLYKNIKKTSKSCYIDLPELAAIALHVLNTGIPIYSFCYFIISWLLQVQFLGLGTFVLMRKCSQCELGPGYDPMSFFSPGDGGEALATGT